jgi:excisionase family DNA binding protein
MEMIKPQEAARLLNVSYPTLKQWILPGKATLDQNPGGHHRIPRAEVERLSGIAVPGPESPWGWTRSAAATSCSEW